jgi:cytochrome b561
LHALAALWHHFILRDGVLRRIWPARNRSERS